MAEEKKELAKKPETFSVALTNEIDKVQDALPKDFNKARFVQNCLAVLNEKPELQKYGANQLKAGLVKGAYLGLDFYSQECYLIPYGSTLTFMPGYKGDVKLAKKYSIRPIKDIYAKLVREGDEFEEMIENGEQSINFKPKPFNDGKIVGAFAVVLYEDGGMKCDSMSLADLENTRNQSKAKNSPAWKNFPGQMYKKTVLRRLCNTIDLDMDARQRELSISGMEIETDVREIARKEIEENENSEPFEVEDENVIDSEAVEVEQGGEK